MLFVIICCQVKEQDDKDNIGDDVIGRNLRAKHIMNVVECEDANENTPISEAGSMTFFFHFSCVARNPVFRVSEQVRHKPGCTTTEAGQRLENLDSGSRGIVLSM